jgi:hypothetical protein
MQARVRQCLHAALVCCCLQHQPLIKKRVEPEFNAFFDEQLVRETLQLKAMCKQSRLVCMVQCNMQRSSEAVHTASAQPLAFE